MLPTPLTLLLAALSFGAQLVIFLRWMHRRIGDDEIQRVFIRDLGSTISPQSTARSTKWPNGRELPSTKLPSSTTSTCATTTAAVCSSGFTPLPM